MQPAKVYLNIGSTEFSQAVEFISFFPDTFSVIDAVNHHINCILSRVYESVALLVCQSRSSIANRIGEQT